MSRITNISCYKFAPLSELDSLREELIVFCRNGNLKGTILLSAEGINLFVAGTREGIDQLVCRLKSIPGLEDLSPKYSDSTHQPFTRMLVRIKREIIAFGVPGIDPARRPTKKLPAATLKQWLDEGRPLALLDTRNDYEVRLGTFKGAMALGIERFRQFPEAVSQLSPEMKKQPIVMFCTGGIRCEKAGPFMEREGFENVFQLDGGILKYFEECGGSHYEGECFVFDHRVGLDPGLKETPSAQCFVCQTPLTREEQDDPRFVPGKSCPHCHQALLERTQTRLEERRRAIGRAVNPLPGSLPAHQRRPFNIPGAFGDRPLSAFLSGVLSHKSSDEWEKICRAGEMVNEDGSALSTGNLLRAGERIYQLIPRQPEPPVNTEIELLHEDEALVVVSKPAPLPVRPEGPFHRNTLLHILNTVYQPSRLRVVDQPETSTTGLVILARTKRHAEALARELHSERTSRTWLVETNSRMDDGMAMPEDAKISILNQCAETTLLEIQMHPPQAGSFESWLRSRFPKIIPRQIHAKRLEFFHPLSQQRLVFEAPLTPITPSANPE